MTSVPVDTLLSNHDRSDANQQVVSMIPQQDGQGPNNIQLSKRRWAILFAITLFGLTTSLTDELGSILHTILKLLDLTVDKYVYISQVFNYIPLLTTIPMAVFIDNYGMKVAMYSTIGLMFIRNGSKALLFSPELPGWEHLKLAYWIITGIAGAQILCIFYCIPLKISENWFAASERSFAWTLMISTANIGLSMGSYVYPRYIHGPQDVKPLCYLNITTFVLCTIAFLTCITRSKPKYPPSERTIVSARPIPHKESFKKMLQNKDLLLHMIHFAVFIGMSTTILIVLQDMLTSVGHSEIFVGNLMSINAIVSLVAIVVFSSFVHRANEIVFVCKFSSFLMALTFTGYLYVFSIPMAEWIVISASVVFQVSMSYTMPHFNNMIAHLASGTISEATAAGSSTTLCMLSICLSRVAFISLKRETEGKNDYTHPIIFASFVSLINVMIYVIFFRGKSPERSESVIDLAR